MAIKRETKITFLMATLVFLLLLSDLNQRILLPQISVDNDTSFIAYEPINVEDFRTSKDEIVKLFNQLDPPPPPEPVAAKKPKPKQPEKPKGPTREQKLQQLVDGGAKRLGADVVYLRGVLIDDSRYALMVLVDESLKERTVTVKVGDKLGDFTLSQVEPKRVTFTAGDKAVVLKLFDKNGTSK